MQSKVQELFSIPVSQLNGIKISLVPNLTNKGINTIGEFLFGSSKVIKTATKMSNEEYTAIRESPTLASKQSLANKLDTMIEKAATTKPTPRPAPAQTMVKTSSRNRAKDELAKARESLVKSGKLESFTPPVKSKKTVEPKEMGSIKHLGPKGLTPGKTSSDKSSKRSSKR